MGNNHNDVHNREINAPQEHIVAEQIETSMIQPVLQHLIKLMLKMKISLYLNVGP